MRWILFVFCIGLMFSCSSPGATEEPPLSVSKGVEVKYHYLQSGVYQVEYFASRELSTADRTLLRKVSELIRHNKKTAAYFWEMSEKKVPVYRSDVGLTRAEYDQLAAIFSYKEPERLSGSLEIIKDGERIRFKGEGRLSLLNDLYVNETIGEASFRQVQMTVRNDSLDLSQERIAVGDTIV